jgi:type II secretory pathway pseudopilin PulG
MALTRRHARARVQVGFTLIEVMVSLGVMMVGAMAIIGLQTHTIRANAHARELTTAVQIAKLWSERIKQDGHTWNEIATADGTPSAATALGNTLFLANVTTAPSVFQTIPNTAATRSNGFDFRGNELDLANPAQAELLYYCVSYRPAWVYFGRTLRVDLRVWWPRDATGANIGGTFPACADANDFLNPPNEELDKYHVVYLPTIVRVNAEENF